MPSLHSPVVTVSVPSMSISASWKKSCGCRFHTLSLARLIASSNCRTLVLLNLRQKSPAVVGSGIESAPMALRNASSLRRRSLSFRIADAVLQTRSLAQRVHRQVQHVVRLVIRTPPLENRHARIDGVDQPALTGDPHHQRHAAVNDRLRLVGQFILHPGRTEHRRRSRHHPHEPPVPRRLQPLLNPTLAAGQLACHPACTLFHSKSLRDRCVMFRQQTSNTTNHRGISCFPNSPKQQRKRVRLLQD